MLSVKSYPAEYVASSQTRFVALLDAYRRLIGELANESRSDAGEFERLFVQSVLVSLDASFVHRVRGLEGKDGNALNEVRMLADSTLVNNGVLAANTTIRYVASSSVAGVEIGQPIDPSIDTLHALVISVHDEIRTRYPE